MVQDVVRWSCAASFVRIHEMKIGSNLVGASVLRDSVSGAI